MSDECPTCIKHFSDIAEVDGETNRYPGSEECLSIGSAFGKALGLTRLGINHELLPPGRRTSWPHCHSADEEFVYVIEGTPDVWIDGHLHRLKPGDGVGFPPGTGVSHTVINNTDSPVRLLVVGDARRPDDRGHYPVNPEGNEMLKKRGTHWADAPKRELGPDDGGPARTE